MHNNKIYFVSFLNFRAIFLQKYMYHVLFFFDMNTGVTGCLCKLSDFDFICICICICLSNCTWICEVHTTWGTVELFDTGHWFDWFWLSDGYLSKGTLHSDQGVSFCVVNSAIIFIFFDPKFIHTNNSVAWALIAIYQTVVITWEL